MIRTASVCLAAHQFPSENDNTRCYAANASCSPDKKARCSEDGTMSSLDSSVAAGVVTLLIILLGMSTTAIIIRNKAE
jgi:hypothetical protein